MMVAAMALLLLIKKYLQDLQIYFQLTTRAVNIDFPFQQTESNWTYFTHFILALTDLPEYKSSMLSMIPDTVEYAGLDW